MKSMTFHYLAMAARKYLDFEYLGIPEDSNPLEHFSRTQTFPLKRQIMHLVKVYDENELTVIPKGHTTAVGIRAAVDQMGDTLGITIPRGAVGRPATAKNLDLSGIKDILIKHRFKVRDLAVAAGVFPSAMSNLLGGPMRITPAKLDQVLEGATTLFTGNPAALKELRNLEKNLD